MCPGASRRYGVIIDTNHLGAYKKDGLDCTNYEYLSIGKQLFFSLIKFLDNNKLADNISILIPRLVFEELEAQQKQAYAIDRKKIDERFVRFRELSGFKLEMPDIDYKTHLELKSEAFISKYNITVLGYPTKNVLPKLIKKSLEKKKPFYKKNSASDSGFKDAVIWESILEYAENNNGVELLFLTSDPDFKDEALHREVLSTTGCTIKIFEHLSDLKVELNNAIGLNLEFNQIIEFVKSHAINQIKSSLDAGYLEIETSTGRYDVQDFGIDEQISDINKLENDEYEIVFAAYIWHSTIYSDYAEDPAEDYYLQDNAVETIKMYLKKDGQKIILTSIEFDNLRLDGTRLVKFS